MNRFTSGVIGDGFYIISMEDYSEGDIPYAWKRTKHYQHLNDKAEIDTNDFEERYLTVKWEGNIFYPTFHDTYVDGSKVVDRLTPENIKINRREGENI